MRRDDSLDTAAAAMGDWARRVESHDTSIGPVLTTARTTAIRRVDSHGIKAAKFCSALIGTGMLSGILFLAACIVYDIAMWGCPNRPVAVAWLNLVAAVLYSTEAALDMAWSFVARSALHRAEQAAEGSRPVSQLDPLHRSSALGSAVFHTAITAVPRRLAGSTVRSSLPSESMTPVTRDACWHGLDWNLHTSLWFFFPSLAATYSAMVNEDVWQTAPAWSKNARLINLLAYFTTVGYVVDGFIACTGRCVYRHRVPQEKLLPIIGCTLIIDWPFLGDILFITGATIDLYNLIWPVSALSGVSYILWTIDAICYIIGYGREIHVMLSEGYHGHLESIRQTVMGSTFRIALREARAERDALG